MSLAYLPRPRDVLLRLVGLPDDPRLWQLPRPPVIELGHDGGRGVPAVDHPLPDATVTDVVQPGRADGLAGLQGVRVQAEEDPVHELADIA